MGLLPTSVEGAAAAAVGSRDIFVNFRPALLLYPAMILLCNLKHAFKIFFFNVVRAFPRLLVFSAQIRFHCTPS
jgi:hypothetical protein